MGLINEVKTGLARLEQDDKSLRKFILVIAAALIILGIAVFFFGSHPIRTYWLGGIAAVLLVTGLPLPRLYKHPHTLWIGFSLVLGYFMSRLLLSLLFILVITPIALVMRLAGKDPLNKKIDKTISSYWIKKPQRSLVADDYERQF
ncbi:MAG TPA: SxtJ family membrane protein [bacterium]|nr:SxtJ family membrane protein [bacterium]HPN42597.1 SxtJ family membrane protein [bacterium]